MEQDIAHYFQEVPDPGVINSCDHLLSDMQLIALCTFLSGGTDYRDMHLFGKTRGQQLKGSILQLPDRSASADTCERVFKKLDSDSLKRYLETYGKTS